MNEKVRSRLIEQNPHWKGPYSIPFKDRDIYPKLSKRMKERQILALCGLRRVGKTTLLRKLIIDLLQSHPAEAILYFSFDDFSGCELQDVLDETRSIHGKEPKYLFFDEIQKLENWAEKLKLLYDNHDYKMVVSGSQSLLIRKGARESLAGRAYEFEVMPLDFSEYLSFRGMERLAEKPALHASELKTEFHAYLRSAGFPELAGQTDTELVREYIRETVIKRIVFVDMAKIYPIEDPGVLISILEMLIDNPGMLVDYESFSQELGMSRQTVSKYFDYLEQAHLLRKLYNYSKNRSTSERKLKKYYPTFLSPALSPRQDEEFYSKIVETCCVLNTDAQYFFRDKYQNEIDIVRVENGKPVPIEVKYRNVPNRKNALEAFGRRYAFSRAVVVTKDKAGEQKSGSVPVEYVPVHLFLLESAGAESGGGKKLRL
ncbi:MAG: ATP-binding protein [Candidatus Micrarchaeota archaeon]